jgi:hypothetical protein
LNPPPSKPAIKPAATIQSIPLLHQQKLDELQIADNEAGNIRSLSLRKRLNTLSTRWTGFAKAELARSVMELVITSCSGLLTK